MTLVDKRLSLSSNKFRASNVVQSERFGFAWIPQYGENIREALRYVLEEEGVLGMEKG